MKTIAVTLMGVIPLCAMMSIISGEPCHAGTAYAPEKTTVAIMPLLNLTGDKWEELKTKQVTAATRELVDEFREGGLIVLEPATVAKAIADLKIDLADEENQNRATLYKIGKQVGANLVVLAIITDTSQKEVTHILGGRELQGFARLKIWLVDAKSQSPILSSKIVESRSHTGIFTPMWKFKGSDRQIQAAIDAVKEGFKEFMDGYIIKAPIDRKK